MNKRTSRIIESTNSSYPFHLSNKELVQAIRDTPNNLHGIETLKAELLRRQIEAFVQFDRSSTHLAKVMIWLSIGIGVLTAIQVVKLFINS